MELLTSIEGLTDHVVGGHVDQNNSSESEKELFLSDPHGLLELFVLRLRLWRVPLRICASDARTKTSLDVVLHLGCLAHAAVLSVDLKDESRVHLLVDSFKAVAFESDAPVVLDSVADDLATEVLVDKSSTAQLRNVAR